MQKLIVRNAFVVMALLAVAQVIETAGAQNTSNTEPELKPDPAVIKILDSLGENSAALLPKVKTTGKMNDEVKRFGLHKTGPRPRDYCLKWVWAPDRKRALFCGANAGVPHRLNDVWEYDLASNTWILLWDPDPDLNKTRHMKNKPEEKKALIDSIAMVTNGVLMTRRGAPFDPVHTWWALTYEPNMKAMLWVMGHENKVGYKYKSTRPWGTLRLWAYYPYVTRWEFIRTNPYPRGANASILEYIPDLKGPVWYTRNKKTMQVYDHAKNTWRILMQNSDFKGDLPLTEAVGAYDAENKIMVVHHGGGSHRGKPVSKRTYHYDVKANKWSKVIDSAEGPYGYDNRTPVVYDSKGKCCLLLEKDALWSYRIGDKKWTKITPAGPGLKSRRAFMACYNPEYNVTMADNGQGQVWVYRGKRGQVSSVK